MTDEELLYLLREAAREGVQQLDLSYNGLITLPPEIGELEQLLSLDLCGNELISLPPEMGRLRRLRQLDLRHNQLAALPEELAGMEGLLALDLRDNRLRGLPAGLVWPQMKALDLRENRLSAFPQALLEMDTLQELHLWRNPLLQLPPELVQLRTLILLNLGGNELAEIPPVVWELRSLEHLIVDHTRVTALPPEVAHLARLEYAELHNNRLLSLPSEIGELGQLLTLIVHNNLLTRLPPEIGQLKRLRRLDLHNNQLISLPPEVGELDALEALDVTANPLSIPPEIVARVREPAALITYYLEHLAGHKRPLNEAKMVLVGQGSVGKTSLVKRLLRNTYDPHEGKTEGIAIQPWHVNVNDIPVQLNVWDFGGQEIMHATHQFFLTKRTLYLLVLDTRLSEEENRLEYWLKIIQSFGGDSPVIIVGNKLDQQPLDIDRRGLLLKYPQIAAIVETSCVTGEGVDKLKARVAREITRLPHVRDELLNAWFEVKQELEGLERDYIPYEEYLHMCMARGIDDEQSQRTLIGFLHDLGIVLNFQDDPRLEDTNILNPEWVTSGVYRILNDEVLLHKRGCLERADLDRILDHRHYPRHKHQFILDMMRKFELCFEFEGPEDERFFIPDLLSKEAPLLLTGDASSLADAGSGAGILDAREWRDALAFQYHYNVLPSSVISRFIVRMHPYLHQDIYWRSGAVVADQENVALVRADREDRRVYIQVRGPEHTRRVLLSVIRGHFDTIHRSIPGIQVEEKVALPEHPDIVVDYQYLLDLEAMGEKHFVPPGLRRRMEVKPLLDGVDLSHAQRKPLRVRQLLLERFSEDELRALGYDLGVEYPALPADGKLGRVTELVAYLQRRDLWYELLAWGTAQRPDVNWEFLRK